MRDKALALASKTALGRTMSSPFPKNAVPKGTISGHGLYKIGGKSAGGAIGGAVGKLFGDTAGKVGEFAGDLFHRGIKSIFGIGSYQLRSAALHDIAREPLQSGQSLLMSGTLPLFNSKTNSNTIRHEERVGDIYGSAGFKLQHWRVNPGVSATFPWMSSLARMYSQYRIVGMIFSTKTILGPDAVGGSNVLGQWAIATRYGANTRPPQNYNDICTSEYVRSDNATRNIAGIVECDPSQNAGTPWKEVSLDGAAIAEQLASDHCCVELATQGFPAELDGKLVGGLWVTYLVEFDKPESNSNSSARSSTFYSGKVMMGATAGSASFPINTVPTTGSTLGGVIYDSQNSLSLPKIPGRYQLSVQIICDSITVLNGDWSDPIFGPDCTGFDGFLTLNNSVIVPRNNLRAKNANWAMMTVMFDYTAATNGLSPDVRLPTPGIPSNCNYVMIAQLVARETDLQPITSLSMDASLRDMLAEWKILPPVEVNSTVISDYVVEYTTVDGVPSSQSWPYTGPVPPPQNEDEADDVSSFVEHVSASSATGPVPSGLRNPSPEELRATESAALEMIRKHTNGSSSGYSLSAMSKFLSSPRAPSQ